MSEASLQALAPEFNGTTPDPRRFRMTITITGTDAWAEHGWRGQRVSIGEAILRVIAPVPRCAVTTRNPDTGATDVRILHARARLRGKNDITFGIWCDIIRPGRIHVGDLVVPLSEPGRAIVDAGRRLGDVRTSGAPLWTYAPIGSHAAHRAFAAWEYGPRGRVDLRPATRHDVGKTVKRDEPPKKTRRQKG